MHEYAAFLGHQPILSIAELSATIPGFSLKLCLNKRVAIFSSAYELPDGFIDTLGGTIVLARKVDTKVSSMDDLPSVLKKELASAKKGKVTFSLRTEGVDPKTIRRLYRDCKDALKNIGRSSRYVGNDKKAAQAIVLHEHGVLNHKTGCELVCVYDEEDKDLWVGRTVGAQDVEAYTKRDMEKPARDTQVGLLPPKLAQTMLNLGAWMHNDRNAKKAASKKFPKQKPLHVFDPFCGTGVIPLECLVKGWSVDASDLSAKAVKDCTANIEWYRKEEKILKKDVPTSVEKHDARKEFSLKQQPNIVVTETTLGTPLTKRPTLKDVQKLKTENEALQAAFIENAAESLPGVPLVLCFPVWYSSKGAVFLSKIWETIENAGYQIAKLNDVPYPGERPTIVYRRPDQFVGREIVLLEPADS